MQSIKVVVKNIDIIINADDVSIARICVFFRKTTKIKYPDIPDIIMQHKVYDAKSAIPYLLNMMAHIVICNNDNTLNRILSIVAGMLRLNGCSILAGAAALDSKAPFAIAVIDIKMNHEIAGYFISISKVK